MLLVQPGRDDQGNWTLKFERIDDRIAEVRFADGRRLTITAGDRPAWTCYDAADNATVLKPGAKGDIPQCMLGEVAGIHANQLKGSGLVLHMPY